MLKNEKNGNYYNDQLINQLHKKLSNSSLKPYHFSLVYDVDSIDLEPVKLTSASLTSHGFYQPLTNETIQYSNKGKKSSLSMPCSPARQKLKNGLKNNSENVNQNSEKIKKILPNNRIRHSSTTSQCLDNQKQLISNANQKIQTTRNNLYNQSGKFYHLSFEPIRIEDYDIQPIKIDEYDKFIRKCNIQSNKIENSRKCLDDIQPLDINKDLKIININEYKEPPIRIHENKKNNSFLNVSKPITLNININKNILINEKSKALANTFEALNEGDINHKNNLNSLNNEIENLEQRRVSSIYWLSDELFYANQFPFTACIHEKQCLMCRGLHKPRDLSLKTLNSIKDSNLLDNVGKKYTQVYEHSFFVKYFRYLPNELQSNMLQDVKKSDNNIIINQNHEVQEKEISICQQQLNNINNKYFLSNEVTSLNPNITVDTNFVLTSNMPKDINLDVANEVNNFGTNAVDLSNTNTINFQAEVIVQKPNNFQYSNNMKLSENTNEIVCSKMDNNYIEHPYKKSQILNLNNDEVSYKVQKDQDDTSKINNKNDHVSKAINQITNLKECKSFNPEHINKIDNKKFSDIIKDKRSVEEILNTRHNSQSSEDSHSSFNKDDKELYELELDDCDASHRGCHKFVPRHPGELAVEIGDLLYVEQEHDDLWCEAYNITTKSRGIFPTAYATDLSMIEEVEKFKFFVKFLGSLEINSHSGNDVLCRAINKCINVKNKQVNADVQLSSLEITTNGIKMVDKSKKNIAMSETLTRIMKSLQKPQKQENVFLLKNITFCGFLPQDDRYFGFITKHPVNMRFACHVFQSRKSARRITEVIGMTLTRFHQEYLSVAYPTQDIYFE